MQFKIKPFHLILCTGITIYFIALLMQCSFQHLLGQDANMISAFGSMLSGVGTIFAAIVAAYLFNDWRVNQDYQNKINSYKNFCSVTDNFIEMFDKYIQALWSVRVNSNEIMQHVNIHGQLANLTYKLDSELSIFKIYFEDLDFEEIQQKVKDIENAIKNISPLSLNGEKDEIEFIYIKEQGDLYILYFAFKNLIYKSIRPQIEKRLNALLK